MMEKTEKQWEFRLISLCNGVRVAALNELLQRFVNNAAGKCAVKDSAVLYVCKKGNKT
jgi:hypothetical protein